jgi:hypothetical protein
MPELETGFLPPLETDPSEDELENDVADTDAPYGRKADGTPRAKPGRKSGSSGGTVSRRNSNDNAFKERISEELVELSAPLAILSPLAMLHVVERADRTANALTVIAKKHPQVKAAILTYFDSVAYKDLALFVIGIPIGVMIDMGVMKPDAVAGRIWSYADKYEELYGEGGSEFAQTNGHVHARGLASEL